MHSAVCILPIKTKPQVIAQSYCTKMARLTILAALLAALLFVAHTTAYKTTITTVEIDDEVKTTSGQGQDSCQKQLQKVNLKHCEKHIFERIQQQEEEKEENVLILRGIYNGYTDLKQKCCDQLSELNSQKCQCQALQQIMEKQSEKLQRREMQDMEKELKNLPKMCGLGPLRGCELRRKD